MALGGVPSSVVSPAQAQSGGAANNLDNPLIENCLQVYEDMGIGPCDGIVNDTCPETLLPGMCCREETLSVRGGCEQMCSQTHYVLFQCPPNISLEGDGTTTTDDSGTVTGGSGTATAIGSGNSSDAGVTDTGYAVGTDTTSIGTGSATGTDITGTGGESGSDVTTAGDGSGAGADTTTTGLDTDTTSTGSDTGSGSGTTVTGSGSDTGATTTGVGSGTGADTTTTGSGPSNGSTSAGTATGSGADAATTGFGTGTGSDTTAGGGTDTATGSTTTGTDSGSDSVTTGSGAAEATIGGSGEGSTATGGATGSGTGPASGDDTGVGTGGETTTGGAEPALLPAQVVAEAACVSENVDGSRTAYLSYENTSSSEVTIETGSAMDAVNVIAAGTQQFPSPTRFAAGRHPGEVSVTFWGEELLWRLKAAGRALSEARVDASTVACKPIKPFGACASTASGKRLALVGYQNPNPFTVTIPIGPLNKLSPGEVDRGQPERFAPGENLGVATVAAVDNPIWFLNGAETPLNQSLLECPNECIDSSTFRILSELDSIALELTNLTKRACLQLIEAKPLKKGDAKAMSAMRDSIRLDVLRSTARSERYLKLAREVTLDWPLVTKSCPTTPTFCRMVDRRDAISTLKSLYAASRGLTARVVIRSQFVEHGTRLRSKPLIRKARRLEIIGNEKLRKLPLLVMDCK